MTDASGHVVCDVAQVPTMAAAPAPGMEGWYYDDWEPASSCIQMIVVTAGAMPVDGAVPHVECVERPADFPSAPPADRAPHAVGEYCDPGLPGLDGPSDPMCGVGEGCFAGFESFVQPNAASCVSRTCMVFHWDEAYAPEEATQRAFCTCRCEAPPGEPTCGCPAGTVCQPVFGVGPVGARGSYCVPQAVAAP
jgi:hypothetical protein